MDDGHRRLCGEVPFGRTEALPALLSYGSLQQRDVQLANYGRELEGSADVLVGYQLVPLAISDPRVLALSGKAVHGIARAQAATPLTASPAWCSSSATPNSRPATPMRLPNILGSKLRSKSGRSEWVYVGPPLNA